MDAAFVTNIMAPYRLPLFRALHAALPGGIGVVCLAQSEPNRSWELWREAPSPAGRSCSDRSGSCTFAAG